MKTELTVPKNEIETEAEDHAEETRYAVSHGGQELHKQKAPSEEPKKVKNSPETPWQVD